MAWICQPPRARHWGWLRHMIVCSMILMFKITASSAVPASAIADPPQMLRGRHLSERGSCDSTELLPSTRGSFVLGTTCPIQMGDGEKCRVICAEGYYAVGDYYCQNGKVLGFSSCDKSPDVTGSVQGTTEQDGDYTIALVVIISGLAVCCALSIGIWICCACGKESVENTGKAGSVSASVTFWHIINPKNLGVRRTPTW